MGSPRPDPGEFYYDPAEWPLVPDAHNDDLDELSVKGWLAWTNHAADVYRKYKLSILAAAAAAAAIREFFSNETLSNKQETTK